MSSNNTNPDRWKNPVIKWIEYRLPIFSMIDDSIGTGYPTPKNLSYWWNFGSLAGIVLTIMIVTGIVLAMQYTPHTTMAFDSVERIMRDVNYGWLLRYLHMNGASMFFIVVYLHMFRGMYYGSYKAPRELLWMIGVLIILAMMATAFMGYVLPWGQMSFWGATVITNLFSAIPLVGNEIVTWLWGGFSVDNPTLNRFFSLHFLLPFVIVGVVFLHVAALHITGSNNPKGIEPKGPQDTLPFHPYYTIKDMFGSGVFLMIFCAVVFFANSALAFYHVGVEQHWWHSVTGCGGGLPTEMSIQSMKADLLKPRVKPCDEVDFQFLGISIATYNVVYSGALGLATLVGLRLMKRSEEDKRRG